MLETGITHKLVITSITEGTVTLGEGEESATMPVQELPPLSEKGQTLEVFIYADREGSRAATTKKPKALPGDFASLEVTGKTGFGLFLDWGLRKDLLLPKDNMRANLRTGDKAVVMLEKDNETGLITATSYLENRLKKTVTDELKVNDKVNVIVYGLNEAGFRVIVNNTWRGMLYKNEIFRDFRLGEETGAWVKRLRPDGLLDLSLQPLGYKASVEDVRAKMEAAFEKYRGFIPLNDDSEPEEIKLVLGISKKAFKKTLGAMLKEGSVTKEVFGIRKK